MAELEELSRDDCFRFLASVPVGRIASTVEGLPFVLPLNFSLLGDDIVLRTGAGVILSFALRRDVVAFEADGWDEAARTGWSVLAQGRLREVTRPDELAQIAVIGTQPWAPGIKGHVLRITVDAVSGRRIPELERPRRDTRPPGVCGPDTPIGALRLRRLVTLDPLTTIGGAIRELGDAGSPVGELGPGTGRLVSLTGLVRAIGAGWTADAAAHQASGGAILVLGGLAPLLHAVHAMTDRGLPHVVVRPTGGQPWGVLTVADALDPLLWVFDPVVAGLDHRTASTS